MKSLIHYIVEYKLVGGGGINRGEMGSMTCTRAFSEHELDEAIRFVNKFECYNSANRGNGCVNIYEKEKQEPKPRFFQWDEEKEYHLTSPKIWHMNLRGDWRAFQQREERTGRKPKSSEWTHIEGDTYCVKAVFFNLKNRDVEYSNYDCATLEEVFKNLKFKDTKTRLLSDWTLYSKHLVKP
jgi:hypothetical protein